MRSEDANRPRLGTDETVAFESVQPRQAIDLTALGTPASPAG